MKKKILIIAPHPDDEVLGCGGIMKKYTKEGHSVFVLILTNGSSVRYGDKMIDTLQKEALSCNEILGVEKVIFKDLPEQKLDGLPVIDIVKEIEAVVDDLKPEVVYTPHKGDINQDHGAIFNATMIAIRSMNKYVQEIYCYETLSSTEWGNPSQEKAFLPNVFVNIENEIEDKIIAMKKYESQMREWPHSRSEEGIRTLAKYRGMQANLDLAESFILIRKINK